MPGESSAKPHMVHTMNLNKSYAIVGCDLPLLPRLAPLRQLPRPDHPATALASPLPSVFAPHSPSHAE